MLNFYLFTFGIARVCKWIVHTIAQILIKIWYYQKIGVKERDMNLYRRPAYPLSRMFLTYRALDVVF